MCVRVTTLVKYMKYNLVKQTHSLPCWMKHYTHQLFIEYLLLYVKDFFIKEQDPKGHAFLEKSREQEVGKKKDRRERSTY